MTYSVKEIYYTLQGEGARRSAARKSGYRFSVGLRDQKKHDL